LNDFIGVSALKRKQAEQLALFRDWASSADWEQFHYNHYDWWAFPIIKSSSYGTLYSLTDAAVALLSDDSEFISNLRECSELLLTAYGWDYKKNQINTSPEDGQYWNNHPIRLAKCNDSLKIFRQPDLVTSTRLYADWLKGQGFNFDYIDNRDLYAEIQSAEPNH
jgi:hypothetical protein